MLDKLKQHAGHRSSPNSPVLKPIYKVKEELGEVAVIGGGWYGAHIAKSFSERGYTVTLYESRSEIFSGISGNFGVRIHAGPHYPRSLATRQTCRAGFHEFIQTYPELVNEHERSIYALGRIDANGNPSKVTEQELRAVSQEFQCKGEIDLAANGYNTKEVLAAFDINEPSAVLGPQLRKKFKKYLKNANVTIRYNFTVTSVQKRGEKILLSNVNETHAFDHVINTTSYQSLTSPSNYLPFNITVVYQPCLALVYQDLEPTEKPISLIVMDGWFPCLMPYDDRLKKTKLPSTKYIVTHGKWTILGSYSSVNDANKALSLVNSAFVEKNIKEPCEKDMIKFWPNFSKRFQYVSFKGAVLAKIKTDSEFRGAVVFQEPIDGMTYVFPGKITNIFDAGREALDLAAKRNISTTTEGCLYIKHGVLDGAKDEISKQIILKNQNTCNLQTFRDILETKVQKPEETKNDDQKFSSLTPQNPKARTLKKMYILFFLSVSAELISSRFLNNKNLKEGSFIILTATTLMFYFIHQQKSMSKNIVANVVSGLSKLGIFNIKTSKIHRKNDIAIHRGPA